MTKYKHDQIIKLLTILGGLVGLAFIIIDFLRYLNVDIPDYAMIDPNVLDPVLELIVGLVVVVITLLAGIRPDDPIPLHWLVLFILAVLLVVFGGGIWACALVLIAGLIALIDST
jgi:hypothetical protein